MNAKKNSWISVKDELPDSDVPVLVVTVDKNNKRRVTLGMGHWYSNRFGWDQSRYERMIVEEKITHWQYLPELPEGE